MTEITINKQQLDKLWNALEYTRATISPSGNFESKEHPGWVEIHKGRAHQSESFLNDAIDLVNQLKKRTETTNEQILELVKEYFEEGGIRDDGSCSEYYGDDDAFVKFAQEIRKQMLGEILTSLKYSIDMRSDECITHLIKVLKQYAEAKHCYERYKFYDVYDERELDETVEHAEEYATIHFARTLLEQIGEEFEYPCMREKE